MRTHRKMTGTDSKDWLRAVASRLASPARHPSGVAAASPREDVFVDAVKSLLAVVLYDRYCSGEDFCVEATARKLARVRESLENELLPVLPEAPVRLATSNEPGTSLGASIDRFLGMLPMIAETLEKDIQAAFRGDPAANSTVEIVTCYPGLRAVAVYRLAHELLRQNVPLVPRILSEWAHRETGIDIHPGARIGPSFFIDHGTGVVIGETCEIGANVTLYQGVTLGAWSFPKDAEGNLIRGCKRHPTLEDGVTVYSNATILGGDTVIGAGARIGAGVSLNQSVPPGTLVTVEEPSLRFRATAA